MRPLRLRLEGFRSFNELELEVPAGCVSLTGENGAGKSSIVDAIDVALFGPDGRSWDGYIGHGGELLVELELEHRGHRYRVRRTAGRRATLDVETFGDVANVAGDVLEWYPLTRGSIAETQDFLERELGLTRETFRASALLRQGAGGAFTEATPKDRKRILANALALDEWNVAADLAGMDRRDAERDAGEVEGAVRILRERIATTVGLEQRLEELRAEVAENERGLEELNVNRAGKAERVEALVREAQARESVDLELGRARVAFKRLADERDAAALAATELAHLEARLPELETKHARLDLVRTEYVAAKASNAARAVGLRDRETLNARVVMHETALKQLAERRDAIINEPAPACDACGQALDTGKARSAALKHVTDKLDETRGGRDEAARLRDAVSVPDEVDITALEDEGAALRDVPAELEAVKTRLAVVRAALERPAPGEAEVAAAAAEVVALETRLAGIPEVSDLDAAKAALAEAVELEKMTRARHELRLGEVGRLSGLVEQAAADRVELAAREAALTDRHERAVDLAELERAFGRDGVPTWIVETHALPAIEAEANRLLAVLGGPVTRVELRTERELKTGRTADALDIVCATDDGERDYATFSGGERTRVNLALRIALARLLAHRRDADVRLLAIDEPDGLDEQGMSALVEVLRDLVTRGEFETTMLASHVPALRDAFDTSITVERDHAGSRAVLA